MRLRGLTLIGLVISLSLLTLVILSAGAIMLTANRFLGTGDAQASLSVGASVVLESIARDISLSFGDQGAVSRYAFEIDTPGPDLGDQIYLRREDIAPLGPDPNDRWISYRFGVIPNTIEFNDNCSSGACAGTWMMLTDNVVNTTPPDYIFQAIDSDGDGDALNDNLIRVEISCRRDPSQPQSSANPRVTLVSAIRNSAASQ